MRESDIYLHAERDARGCLIWQGAIEDNGYGNVNVGGRTWSTHRLSFKISNGSIPPRKRVLHSCDVRACIEPEHLHLGTSRQNSREMVQRARYRGPAKLGPADRARVIEAAGAGEPQRKVAERFGVSQATVSNIVNGKHTALGDARWARRTYDAVTGGSWVESGPTAQHEPPQVAC